MPRDRTFTLHAVVAAVLLVLVAWWVRPTGQVSIDEGAAGLQAEALAGEGTWAVPVALLDQDGDGAARALRSIVRSDDGYAPLTKNPLYPAALGVADRTLGGAGTVGLSVAGTLLAALAGAALARRLDPRLAVPALYALALGSPLLFDSTLLIAHTIGAAAAGGAALAVLRHRESGGDRRWLVVAGFATAACVMVRTEALFLVAAAVVVLLVPLRSRQRAGVAPAAGLASGAVVGVAVSRLWTAAIVRGGDPLAVTPATRGWLSDRLAALRVTAIDLGAASDGVRLRLLLACAALALVAVLLRFGGDRVRLVPVGAALAGVLATSWAIDAPSGITVAGLLAAYPLLWFGLVLGGWRTDGRAVALAGTCALFTLAVVATQYRQGGGFEWGARYVAIALPLATPVALLGVLRALDRVDRPAVTRSVAGSLAVVLIALGAVGAATRRDLGEASRAFGDALLAAAPSSTLAGDATDRRPIIVSAEYLVPQVVWPRYEDARWLHLDATDPIALQRLEDAGVDRYTVVTPVLEWVEPALDDVEVLSEEVVHGWSLLVVRPSR